MRFGIRGKLFLVLFAVILTSVLAADVYLSRALNHQLTNRIRDGLLTRLRLIQDQVSRASYGPDELERWDRLADTLGSQANTRVTIIRRDGTVVGDSELPVDALGKLENYSTRPEVAAALATGRGYSVQFNAELSQRMMYMALPFGRGDTREGTVRAAESLSTVDLAIDELHRALFSGLLVALLLAIVVAVAAADHVSRALRSLTQAAAKMASGDLQIRTGVLGHDELAELGRGLDLLASNLSTAIRALEKERDLLGGIVNAMHEGLLLLDDQGRIAMVNPALRQMLLLGAGIVGKYPLEVIRHADFQELLQESKRSDEPLPKEIELVGLNPRYLLVQAVPIRETGGLLVVFVDVTEIRRLERVRTDFVANVSHELRTPITAIRGYAETLRAGALKDPEVAAGMVEVIFRQSERLSRMVEDLLELSRLEAKELKVANEPVSIRDAATRAAEAVRPISEAKGIRVEMEVPPDLLARGDERAVEQILMNLLENAVKYTAPSGGIKVSAHGHGGRCSIEVRDTGMGIEAKHLPRVFERFYRIDKGRSRDMGGTGLGLSIVKHLAAALHGEVTVKSQPGKGSTFTVVLPQATPELERIVSSGPASADRAGTN